MQRRSGFVALALLGLMVTGVSMGGCDRQAKEPAALAEAVAGPAEAKADYDLSAEPLEPQHGGEIITLSVQGMHCAGCANSIGKALIAVEGVRYGRIAVEEEMAWVEVDPQRADAEALIAAVAASPAGDYRAALAEDTAVSDNIDEG